MVLEGAAEAENRRWQRALSIAWHTEAFARTKRLPRLESLIKSRPAPPQTPEQQLRIAEMLNAAFGGFDHRKT